MLTLTVGVAIAAFFMLPNTPLTTAWLDESQRQLAHDRMVADTTGKKDKINVWKGLREACTDYRTWLFALLQNMHLSANSFKNFMPTVVCQAQVYKNMISLTPQLGENAWVQRYNYARSYLPGEEY